MRDLAAERIRNRPWRPVVWNHDAREAQLGAMRVDVFFRAIVVELHENIVLNTPRKKEISVALRRTADRRVLMTRGARRRVEVRSEAVATSKAPSEHGPPELKLRQFDLSQKRKRIAEVAGHGSVEYGARRRLLSHEKKERAEHSQ